jgi:amino acid transporter
MNEEANFCEYCGSSFRENIYPAPAPGPVYQAPLVSAPENNEKPVSFLNWLGSYAIMFIPFIGIIAFPVMLLIWAFGKNAPESKKNWAKATLIFLVVSIIIYMLLVFVLLNDPQYSNLLNSLSQNQL